MPSLRSFIACFLKNADNFYSAIPLSYFIFLLANPIIAFCYLQLAPSIFFGGDFRDKLYSAFLSNTVQLSHSHFLYAIFCFSFTIGWSYWAPVFSIYATVIFSLLLLHRQLLQNILLSSHYLTITFENAGVSYFWFLTSSTSHLTLFSAGPDVIIYLQLNLPHCGEIMPWQFSWEESNF